MNEVSRMIQQARGHLLQGVATLQTPGLPRDVTSTSAPLERAAGLLDQLETGTAQSPSQTYPVVLTTLQQALHRLQWSPHTHPIVDRAIDHVALALGVVFTMGGSVQVLESLPVETRAPSPDSDSLVAAAVRAAGKTPKAEPAARETAPPLTAPLEPARPERAPERAREAAPAPKEQAPSDEPLLTKGLPRVEAALGANSPTNFYRGFEGDDVVDHGGLFVATYHLPEVGRRVAVHVALPDGNEFFAEGTVRWRRLATDDGAHSPDSPPGFGLRLESVSDRARTLISRYVKNRDPLFHDDE